MGSCRDRRCVDVLTALLSYLLGEHVTYTCIRSALQEDLQVLFEEMGYLFIYLYFFPPRHIIAHKIAIYRCNSKFHVF